VLIRCGADQRFGDSCGHVVNRRAILRLYLRRPQCLTLCAEAIQKFLRGPRPGKAFELDVPFESADPAAEILGDKRSGSLASKFWV